MKLEDFWPLETHVDECIFVQAESASDPAFLAVHQPMTLLKKKYDSDAEALEVKEPDLFDAFMEENPASGTVVLPIVGDSAVGKSHMIRWIDARLKQGGLNRDRHIVRIPKSAGMKKVLDLIVEGLEGDRYTEIKEAITRAQVRDDPRQARLDLRAKLTGAVEQTRDELQGRAQNEELDREEHDLLTHCKGLYHLLNDAGIAEHFLDRPQETSEREGALTRIVAPLIGEAFDPNRERENQFDLKDLDFVQNVDHGEVAARTRPYFNMLANRQEKRQGAVNTLNTLLDTALKGLIDFSGDSLPDLFDRIRSALLAEGKELVLLIEDFATLGGVQQDLLDAVTNPAVRHGKQEYCFMRTAIAVTEGRLDHATVLTRAGYEWKIDNHPFENEEEAVTYFTNMVGAYLNAARHGETELKRLIRTTNEEKVEIPNFWETHKEELLEKDQKTLEAFGFSKSKHYSLFPFNEEAIRQIMDLKIKKEGRYQFKPRALNGAIREIIKEHRDNWMEGQFPPDSYEQFDRYKKLGREVFERLDAEPECFQKRLGVLLGFWGGRPNDLTGAAALDPAIYEAFGLPPVKWGVKPATKKKATTKKKTEVTSKSKPTDKPRWKNCLQPWKEDSTIAQENANQLRTWIAEAIAASIDPDPLLRKKLDPKDIQKSVFIPHATTGNPKANSFPLIPISEEDLSSAKASKFWRSMNGLINFHDGKTWDYENGHKDQISYLVLIERLAKEWIAHLKEERTRHTSEIIAPLAQSLLIGARILNLENSISSNAEDLMIAILDPGPDQPFPITQQDRWRDLKKEAQQARGESRHKLLEHVSARQGGHEGSHAVDAATLLPALDALQEQDWQFPEDTPNKWADTPQLQRFLRSLTRRTPTSVVSLTEAKAQEIYTWRTTVDEHFGVDFDCDMLLDELQNTINTAVDAGCFRFQQNRDHRPLKQQIEGLRQRGDDLRETYTKSKEISPEDSPFGAKLSIVSQIDYELMAETESLIDSINKFLTQTSGDIDGKLRGAPDPKAKSKQLQDSLETLQDHWNNVSTHIVS